MRISCGAIFLSMRISCGAILGDILPLLSMSDVNDGH